MHASVLVKTTTTAIADLHAFITDRHDMPHDWTQDEIDEDHGILPFICPVTGAPCITEENEFCDDYGCARRAGIDVDRDIV